VATDVYIQVEVFWIVTLCSDAVGYQRLGRPCCLHLQDRVNTGTLQQHSTASQARRPRHGSSRYLLSGERCVDTIFVVSISVSRKHALPLIILSNSENHECNYSAVWYTAYNLDISGTVCSSLLQTLNQLLRIVLALLLTERCS
jgi:hypothetical protein